MSRFALLWRTAIRSLLPLSSIFGRMSRFPKPLRPSDGPLVWIDCEMTGLNPKKDRLLEVAVLITNKNLDIVDDGIQYVIKTDKECLDQMDEWCVNQHARSGLTQECIDSPHELETVEEYVLQYIKGWVPDEKLAPLAGSSVWADKSFLVEGMPQVVKHLHYRIVDVSTIKELCERWYSGGITGPTGDGNHRAMSDIRASIAVLKFYRERYFVHPESLTKDQP